MSPAKMAVRKGGTAEDPKLVPIRAKIWISSQWAKIKHPKSSKKYKSLKSYDFSDLLVAGTGFEPANSGL